MKIWMKQYPFAKKLSAKTGSIIVATGTIDIVADSNKAYIIRNGHQLMSKFPVPAAC
jgi:hydroxyethylthiazole kinase